MITYYASPERAGKDKITRDIDFACNNAVICGVLRSSYGILAILNEHRQILAVNETFLKELGIEDGSKVLGLRPGEAVDCTHAHELEGGCGTSKWCSTCGAAISIVTALANEEPVERKCVLTVKKEQGEVTMCLAVRSNLLEIDGKRFVVIYLQDISENERHAALERIFLHDINNILTGIHCLSDLMQGDKKIDYISSARKIFELSSRLKAELALQSALVHESSGTLYKPEREEVSIEKILSKLENFFTDHPAVKNKKLTLPKKFPDKRIKTDPPMLLRVLTNMLMNAFEATETGGEVKLDIVCDNDTITFSVWNKEYIPEDIQRRIFQQYFSTKNGKGRGLGTYSIKLIGELFLRGKVSFSSQESKGTVFRFELPQK